MHRPEHSAGWMSRLVAVVLVALPVLTIGLASPAMAGGGDYGGGGGNGGGGNGGGGNGGGGYGGGHNPGPICPNGTAAVTAISFVINGTTTVTTLRGNVQPGVSVQAKFSLAAGCSSTTVSLASYRAPAGTYDRNTANQQVLFDSTTGTFGGSPNTLQVFVPAGCFQVDFVLGGVITRLGPANTNNFYGDQGRLIDHDNGYRGCTTPPTSGPLCNLTAILPGPPKQLQVTVQDAASGLKSIVVTTLTNATVVVPTFTVGTAQALVVVATKVDQTQGAYLGLQVTDLAGLVTNCDPPF